MSALARLKAYAAHGDPLVAASNTIALLIASNQPFYPLYIWWLAGEEAARIALLTWFSTPLFCAVPAVARLDARAGRALVVIAGAANTFICAKAFGPQSAVELFLAPCAMVAALAFRRSEAGVAGLLLGAGFAAFALLHSRYGAPLLSLTPAQTDALVWLNVYSVAGLTALIGWTYAGAHTARGDQST